MIGNPVSLILPGMTGMSAAERALACQPDEDAGRAADATIPLSDER